MFQSADFLDLGFDGPISPVDLGYVPITVSVNNGNRGMMNDRKQAFNENNDAPSLSGKALPVFRLVM